MFIFHKSILFMNYKHIFSNIKTKSGSNAQKEIHRATGVDLMDFIDSSCVGILSLGLEGYGVVGNQSWH